MTRQPHNALVLWRVALGLAAGATTTSLLSWLGMQDVPIQTFLSFAAITALVSIILVVIPFIIVAWRTGRLTLAAALIAGALLTGLPTLAFNIFMQVPTAGDQTFIVTRTLFAVAVGLAGAAVAWIVAIGFRADAPRTGHPDGH